MKVRFLNNFLVQKELCNIGNGWNLRIHPRERGVLLSSNPNVSAKMLILFIFPRVVDEANGLDVANADNT